MIDYCVVFLFTTTMNNLTDASPRHGLCLREAIKENRDNAPKHMFCIQDHPNINPASQQDQK